MAEGVDGASGDSAFHRSHHERGVLQGALTVCGRTPGRQLDAEVGGDRVEAAGMDDPGPGLPRLSGDLVQSPPDEEHLAGEVGVVGALLSGGPDDLPAIAGVGAHRRREDAGADASFSNPSASVASTSTSPQLRAASPS